MERIISPTKTKFKKVDEEEQESKKGKVLIRDKKNGKEAIITLLLNIPNIKNPRLYKYGATEKIAKQNLAKEVLLLLINLEKSEQYTNIQLFSPELQKQLNSFDEYKECLTKYKSQLIVPNSLETKQQLEFQSNIQNKLKPEVCPQVTQNIVKHPFSEYIYEMIRKKKQQSEMAHTKRRKKISPATVIYYLGTAKKQVIPFFGNLDVTQITENMLQDHFDNLDYSEKYLKDIRLVIKLSLDIAVKEKIIAYNPAPQVKIDKNKKSLGIEIEHLEQDRQEVWLDIIEKDKRQWAYLFEALLLTGARPEEGCRIQMDCYGL